MKPPASLLEDLAADEAPSAKVTVTVEQAPDWKAMGRALLSAIKAGDETAAAQAVRAIAMCCEADDEEMDSED